MNCRDKKMLKLISRKIDSKTTPDEENVLRKHMEVCPECRERFEYLEKAIGVISRGKISIPAGLTGKVMAGIRGLGEDDYIGEESKRLPWLKPVSALAFAMIAVLVSVTLLLRKPSETILVKFRAEIPDVNEVCLVGDFNDWDENVTKMKKKNGVWTVELKLKPERYQYMFLVDGERWIADPLSKEYIDDGYGNRNSIIDIRRI